MANDVKTHSYAVYSHLDFKLTDDWTLTAGGRYTFERKKFLGGQSDLDGFSYKASGCLDPTAPAHNYIPPVPSPGPNCQQLLGFPVPGQPLRYFPNEWDSQNWNVFTPTYGTQYQITPDIMAYASYSKGFKSGGWTTRLSDPISSPVQARFSPEYDKSYELGLKSQWFDHHLQANLAVFESKYDAIQLNVQEGPSPVYQNAGNATIKGAELELQTVFNNGLSLLLAGAYLDDYYTYLNPCLLYYANTAGQCVPSAGSQYVPGVGGFSYESQLPKTPRTKVSFSPTYDFHVPNGGMVRVQSDYTYVSRLYNDSLNTVELERQSTNTVNAAVHYTPPSKHYEFIAGGTNLGNNRYVTTGSTNYAAGEVVAAYNPPRMWYFTVNAKMP